MRGSSTIFRLDDRLHSFRKLSEFQAQHADTSVPSSELCITEHDCIHNVYLAFALILFFHRQLFCFTVRRSGSPSLTRFPILNRLAILLRCCYMNIFPTESCTSNVFNHDTLYPNTPYPTSLWRLVARSSSDSDTFAYTV